MARPFPAATSPFLIIGCGSVEPMGRYPAEQACEDPTCRRHTVARAALAAGWRRTEDLGAGWLCQRIQRVRRCQSCVASGDGARRRSTAAMGAKPLLLQVGRSLLGHGPKRHGAAEFVNWELTLNP